jgi:thiol-disulfide isomerase/thioredoxin
MTLACHARLASTLSTEKVKKTKTIRIGSEGLKQMKSEGRDFYLVFTADWCGYCAALKREIASAPENLELYEFDVSDEECPAWDEYAVKVVPTALYFEGGREKSRKAASFAGLRVRDIKGLSSSP